MIEEIADQPTNEPTNERRFLRLTAFGPLSTHLRRRQILPSSAAAAELTSSVFQPSYAGMEPLALAESHSVTQGFKWTKTLFSFTSSCTKTPIDTGACVQHCNSNPNNRCYRVRNNLPTGILRQPSTCEAAVLDSRCSRHFRVGNGTKVQCESPFNCKYYAEQKAKEKKMKINEKFNTIF